MNKAFFGTDGVRGKVGEYPITPDFMLKLGWAAGKVFAKEGSKNNVLIVKKSLMFRLRLHCFIVS